MSLDTALPGVFEAGLPVLAYDLLDTPSVVYPQVLACSMSVFCDHPDQWALLGEHPELAMGAIEESMRHSPAAVGSMRVATEDAEFGGYLFPRDTFVVVNTCAANRDPAIYDDPDRFDITRESLPGILAFGGGVHYCLGANLARLELAEALKLLARRVPNPRRTEPPAWKPMLGLGGQTSLPIAFDASPSSPSNA